jgi:hypothetical protein
VQVLSAAPADAAAARPQQSAAEEMEAIVRARGVMLPSLKSSPKVRGALGSRDERGRPGRVHVRAPA